MPKSAVVAVAAVAAVDDEEPYSEGDPEENRIFMMEQKMDDKRRYKELLGKRRKDCSHSDLRDKEYLEKRGYKFPKEPTPTYQKPRRGCHGCPECKEPVDGRSKQCYKCGREVHNKCTKTYYRKRNTEKRFFCTRCRYYSTPTKEFKANPIPKIEGSDAHGIHLASTFLEKTRRYSELDENDDNVLEGLNPKGKSVVVLGGSFVAPDCISACNRLDCKFVETYEIFSNRKDKIDNSGQSWPENPLVLSMPFTPLDPSQPTSSKAPIAQDPRKFAVALKRFVSETNSAGVKVLTGLEVVEVNWEWKHDENVWKLEEDLSSAMTIECNFCIIDVTIAEPDEPDEYPLISFPNDPEAPIKLAVRSLPGPSANPFTM